ncbi:MAG TPA: hypothetical protein VFC90_01240, partial [Planctomycetota bacterium]|nr:hypothetical protein [Planctomycetota bacterium]
SPSRFLVEVRERDFGPFERATDGVPRGCVGQVTETGRLEMIGRGRAKILNAAISDLKEAWQRPLKW